MGLKSEKNFIVANAVEVILSGISNIIQLLRKNLRSKKIS